MITCLGWPGGPIWWTNALASLRLFMYDQQQLLYEFFLVIVVAKFHTHHHVPFHIVYIYIYVVDRSYCWGRKITGWPERIYIYISKNIVLSMTCENTIHHPFVIDLIEEDDYDWRRWLWPRRSDEHSGYNYWILSIGSYWRATALFK